MAITDELALGVSSGTGGGGGFSLGPETNEFNNTNARNTYEAANPTWLAQYAANRSFLIAVGTTTIDYQRRNLANTDWESVSNIIRGEDGDDGTDGTDGTDGQPGTPGRDGANTVTINPAGTDGDTATRIEVNGTNWNLGGTSTGGMSASWERRLVPSVTIDGVRPASRTGTLSTAGSFQIGGGSNVRAAFIQFVLPDSIRASIAGGIAGVSFRLAFRLRGRSGQISTIINISIRDTDNDVLGTNGNVTFAGDDLTTSTVISIPAGNTDIDDTGVAYIRFNWQNGTFNDPITIDNMTLEASIQDTDTDTQGLTSVEPQNLAGITRPFASAGALIAIKSDDVDAFEQIDPSTLGGSDPFDLWADVTVTRNAIADTDRFVVAWSQGSGQPNRAVTFETLKNELRWPSITQFAVTGPSRVAAGTNISGDIYRYSTQIAQAGHASAVRLIGYTGNNVANPAATETVLATLASSVYAHASGQIAIPANTTLANAGDAYNLRLEAYEQGQTVGTDIPVAYHDFRIIAQADSALTHFGFVLSTEAAADINFTQDDISTMHGVAGTWTVSGLPMSGLQRLYWAVPTSEAQPSNWEQGGTTIAPTIEAAVTRTINSVEYQIYLFAAANAVGNVYNGTTITVTA